MKICRGVLVGGYDREQNTVLYVSIKCLDAKIGDQSFAEKSMYCISSVISGTHEASH